MVHFGRVLALFGLTGRPLLKEVSFTIIFKMVWFKSNKNNNSIFKGILVGISSSGSRIGNVFALSFGGYLCVNGFAGGWPSIFYVFGMMGVSWFFLFIFLTSKTPQNHKFISDKEKSFILEETKKSIETREYCQSVIICST